jgi:hypothetical protein
MPSAESERYGSLLMAADHLPRDRHGYPYQVILLLLPGGGTQDLRRDEQGRVLAWVLDAQARPILGPTGEPLTEPVPAEVQAEAEQWLARQMDPAFEPTPSWQPGDRIICSDCGTDLDPEGAIPYRYLTRLTALCARCHATREELDKMLD